MWIEVTRGFINYVQVFKLKTERADLEFHSLESNIVKSNTSSAGTGMR